jgi:hypothetical protein
VPRLGGGEGWGATFGRELNASDDRGKFRRASGAPYARPVVEGKLLDPYRVRLGDCRFELRPDAHVPDHIGGRDRLAYRDVASATNRLTLIAAIVPARAVTTHTLFCLRTPLGSRAQHVLCALLNSFVANYLVRLRVHTHVTVSLVARLPVPFLRQGHPGFAALASASLALTRSSAPLEEAPEYAETQAISARLYGLQPPELEHVLSTFPLVSPAARERTLERFVHLAPDQGPPNVSSAQEGKEPR